jgi:two-component system, OmpR family, sensor histidine kinase TctE
MMPFRDASLKRRLLIWLAMPLTLLWCVSAYNDYDIAKRFVNTAYDRTLLESALDIGRNIKVLQGRTYVDIPDIALRMLRSVEKTQVYYLVTGPDDEYISGDPDLDAPPPNFSGQVHYYDITYRGVPVRVTAISFPVNSVENRGEVTVQVGETLAARNGVLREVLLRIVLPQIILGLIALAVVWFAVDYGLAGLRGLREAIERRSHRDLSPLQTKHAALELQPIIEAMNGLMYRLGAILSSQQRFLANAAHQLRTPITGLRTQTELALRQASPTGMKAALEQVQSAAESMSRLVNQLLSLARTESAPSQTQTTASVDLAVLARTLTAEWVPRALAKNIDLGYDGTDTGCMIAGDSILLGELLSNLLDNAIRHTQENINITVGVSADAQSVVLGVEDNGPGIPKAEREHVLERFYRVLGTAGEGCGLGLAIVVEIAARHDATVTVLAGKNDQGTLVRITFPRQTGNLAA